MAFFGVLIGIIIFSATAYMALNKKSNFLTRIVALGAIAVMIITLIICIFIIFSDRTVPLDPSTLIVGEVKEPEKKGGNTIFLMLFVVFFVLIFGIIFIFSMREHKKIKKKN